MKIIKKLLLKDSIYVTGGYLQIAKGMLRVYLVLLLSLIYHIGFGQTEVDTLSKKEKRKARTTYYSVGTGVNFIKFRDYATSPLFYSGMANTVMLSKLRQDDKRESQFGGTFLSAGTSNIIPVGKLTAKVEDEIVGSSSFMNANLFYTQLYQIPISSLNPEKWNLKVGGTIMSNWTLRRNEALQNNALGFEGINTLFASTKITRDISRKKEVQKKFLFIKYKLKPKKRFLSYQLNLGLINSTFRNGFAYLNQSGIVSDAGVFDAYVFKVFSGYRINSALESKTYLKNGNAIALGYQWDALWTGGELDQFQMAQHIISFSFHFNTK